MSTVGGVTLTLTDFLRARIAEDEELGRWGRLADDPSDPDSLTKILRWDHGRVLAECEAKRRIVERFVEIEPIAAVSPGGAIVGAMNGLHLAVQDLAAIYAAHEDYREEWKP